MPMMNMAAALTNPYTLDVFDVVRRAESESSQGLTVIAPVKTLNVRGVVTPAGDNSLKRGADSQEQSKGLQVTTLFGLRGATLDGAAQTWQPDIISWRGNQYIVRDVADYGAYAAGFVQAGCELLDSAAVPPSMGALPPVFDPLVPSTVAVVRGKYTPVETLDGVRKAFTFTQLPASPNNYLLIWNGVIQDSLTATGLVLSLPSDSGAPKPGDSFYILVY